MMNPFPLEGIEKLYSMDTNYCPFYVHPKKCFSLLRIPEFSNFFSIDYLIAFQKNVFRSKILSIHVHFHSAKQLNVQNEQQESKFRGGVIRREQSGGASYSNRVTGRREEKNEGRRRGNIAGRVARFSDKRNTARPIGSRDNKPATCFTSSYFSP